MLSPAAKRLESRNRAKLDRALEQARVQRDLFERLQREMEEVSEPEDDSGGCGARTLQENNEGQGSQDDSHIPATQEILNMPVPQATQESQRLGKAPPVQDPLGRDPLVQGGQLELSPRQKQKRNQWTEADQQALIEEVTAHKPWARQLKNAQRKSKWRQIVAAMQLRENMKHVLTEHAVRQKYLWIMQWYREVRREDEKATGAREKGQNSDLMRACGDLAALQEKEEAEERQCKSATKKVQGILSDGAAYQARLANSPAPPAILPQKRKCTDDDEMDDAQYMANWLGRGRSQDTSPQDQFVHGSNGVFQAAYATLAKGPPTQSGKNADLIEFMREQAREQREQAREQREWLSQYQKATQEAQKEVTSMMTSMMSAIVGSLKKAD